MISIDAIIEYNMLLDFESTQESMPIAFNHTFLKEEGESTADIAQGPGSRGPVQHRGLPVFKIDSHNEFQNFNRGTKLKFKQWRKLVSSPEVHEWASNNKGKDFYINHQDIFIKVKRSK